MDFMYILYPMDRSALVFVGLSVGLTLNTESF